MLEKIEINEVKMSCFSEDGHKVSGENITYTISL